MRAILARILWGRTRKVLIVALTATVLVSLVGSFVLTSRSRAANQSVPGGFTGDTVLFVHGVEVHGNVFNSPTPCPTYFDKAIPYLQNFSYLLSNGQVVHWTGAIKTIGYYFGDTNCSVNLADTDTLYGDKLTGWEFDAWKHCSTFTTKHQYQEASSDHGSYFFTYDSNSSEDQTMQNRVQLGTNNDPIEHIACVLAWYIYDNYTVNGQNVDIVDHSMGGLIARWAISLSRNPVTDARSAVPTSGFPRNKLLVRDVVAFDSPFGGDGLADLAHALTAGGVQVAEMNDGSPFVRALQLDRYPQGAQGTNWTQIGNVQATPLWSLGLGALCPNVSPDSATDMSAGYKVWYWAPCYTHIGAGSPFNDDGETPAQAFYCNANSMACGGQRTAIEQRYNCDSQFPGQGGPIPCDYPRPLCRMLDALDEIPVDPLHGQTGDCIEVANPVIHSVYGKFFPNPGAAQGQDSISFNILPGTPPLFTGTYPDVQFDPPVALQSCVGSGVDDTTRPFTDVTAQSDGTCSTTVAQGNGMQAGVGNLTSFEAVFTTSITVSAPGNVLFSTNADDAYILSVGSDSTGSQPTFVSGEMLNPPASGTGPFTGYPVMGAWNYAGRALHSNVVFFPEAGTYPIELDYVECCGDGLSLVLTAAPSA